MQRLKFEITDRDRPDSQRTVDIESINSGIRINIQGSPNSLDLMLVDNRLVVDFVNVPVEKVPPWAFNLCEKRVSLNLGPPTSHWDDDPEFPAEDWLLEAGQDNTRLGYADWVKNQRMMREDEDDRSDPSHTLP